MRYLLLTLILLLSHPLCAQHQLIRQVYDSKSNTWAKVTCLFGKLPAHGYAPIRVEINNGTLEARNFTLDFTSSDDGYYGDDSGSRIQSSFQCSVEPGRRESFDFLVPLTTIFQTSRYGSGTTLNLNLSASGFATSTGRMYTEINDSWPTAIISKPLYIPNASALTNQLSSIYSSSNDLQFGGDCTPSTMPADWRAYIGLDLLMLTGDDWSKLDPGARSAILSWNRLGGRLVIYTANNSENLTTLQIAPDKSTQRNCRRSLGLVSLLPLPQSKRLDPAQTYRLASGAIRRKSSTSPAAAGQVPSTYKTEHNSLLHDYSTHWPLHTVLGKKQFHAAIFILILIAFGILVGPINLFVFAPAGKRHKLFITTPIISLGASAILILIILFQDGFGGRGHRIMLMEINAEENKTYIIQEQAARTGVLIRRAFETSEAAMISPVALQPSRWSRVVLDGSSPNHYSANHHDQGLSLDGDWFQSRSVHGHILKTVRPSRGRIELSPQASTPTLTSSLDSDLSDIYYQAPDGSWWYAQALAKGNRVTLKPSNATAFSEWLQQQGEQFSEQNRNHLRQLATQPGRFYATSDNARAIESYHAIHWLSTSTVLTGPLKHRAAPES